MKRIVTLGLLVATIGVTAQHRRHQRQPQKALKEHSPKQRATLVSKKMVLALDLDTRQQEQVESLLKKRFETREKMRTARRGAAADSSKRSSSNTRYALMNTRLDREIAFQREMKDILTETQFEDWKQRYRAKRQARHKEQRQHRPRRGTPHPERR